MSAIRIPRITSVNSLVQRLKVMQDRKQPMNNVNYTLYVPKNNVSKDFGFSQPAGPKFKRPFSSNSEDPRSSFPMRPQRRGLYTVNGKHFPPQRSNEHESKIFSSSGSGVKLDNYDNVPVSCEGVDVPPPIESFSTLDFGEVINLNVNLCHYDKPTPIQKYSLPILLQHKDIMACAQTGSGKTAAFLLPVVDMLFRNRSEAVAKNGSIELLPNPSALIVAPTRELVQQIYADALKLSYRTTLRIVSIFGGASPAYQINQIERGCDILVATPGRLIDLINQNIFSLENVSYLVLDEADRMLDMGFEPQIRRAFHDGKIQSAPFRQTVMFSATFPPKIQQLAREFLSEPLFISAGRVGSINASITQVIEQVEDNQKLNRLLSLMVKLLQDEPESRILIFTKTKRDVDYLEEHLYRAKHKVVSIHGDRSQADRDHALSLFKNREAYVMIATDVAQRGLDIPSVSHVINYSLPTDIDEYVHRVGRTGRAGNTGVAISFYNDSNSKLARDLKNILREGNQPVPDFLKEDTPSFYNQPRSNQYNRSYGGGNHPFNSRSNRRNS